MEYIKKLSPAEKELYQRVDETIHYLWDPIGVKDYVTNRDEYYGYLPQIVKVLKTKNQVELVNHLDEILKSYFNITPVGNHHKEIAEVLIAWLEEIEEKYKVEF